MTCCYLRNFLLGVFCKIIHASPIEAAVCATVFSSSFCESLGTRPVSLYNACFGSEITNDGPPGLVTETESEFVSLADSDSASECGFAFGTETRPLSRHYAGSGSELTHVESSDVFCNICQEFNWQHAPSTSFENQLYYPTSCLAPSLFSGLSFFNFLVSLCTLSCNVYSLTEAEGDSHDSPDGLDFKSRSLLVHRLQDQGYIAVRS